MSRRGPRFDEELAILKEEEKNDVKAVCAKYHISTQSYRLWRYKTQRTKPRKYLPVEEKLHILEEGYENSILRTCASNGIYLPTYCYWKRRLGYSKSLRAGQNVEKIR
jgi:hypothetical protein